MFCFKNQSQQAIDTLMDWRLINDSALYLERCLTYMRYYFPHSFVVSLLEFNFSVCSKRQLNQGQVWFCWVWFLCLSWLLSIWFVSDVAKRSGWNDPFKLTFGVSNLSLQRRCRGAPDRQSGYVLRLSVPSFVRCPDLWTRGKRLLRKLARGISLPPYH